MRDIKFRAWFEGHMYEVAKLDFWRDQASCDLVGTGENGEWEEPLFDIYVSDVELMQSTGLKDKNGKEIYEGDIVHCFSAMDSAIMVVVFEEGEFKMVLYEDFDEYKPGSGYYTIRNFTKKVLGHIYSSTAESVESDKPNKGDALRAQKLLSEVTAKRRKLSEGWKPRFRGKLQSIIYYDAQLNKVLLMEVDDYHYGLSIFGFFEHEWQAQAIIDEFGEELKWYFTDYLMKID